jgi:hypothetical protein
MAGKTNLAFRVVKFVVRWFMIIFAAGVFALIGGTCLKGCLVMRE